MKSDDFIYEYLKCDRDTSDGSYEKLLDAIKEIDDWETVKQYIIKLKYFYYLRTSLWRIISEEIKRRAKWICACGCRENLQVHHTEEGNAHHGEEHLFLSALVCVCQKCHQKKHPIASVKLAEKKRRRNLRKENILTQLPSYPDRVAEENISGSSFVLTRDLLEELEKDRKIVIERLLYDGWKIHRV